MIFSSFTVCENAKTEVKNSIRDSLCKTRSCFPESPLVVFKSILSRYTMASFNKFCKAVARENDTGDSRCKDKTCL